LDSFPDACVPGFESENLWQQNVKYLFWIVKLAMVKRDHRHERCNAAGAAVNESKEKPALLWGARAVSPACIRLSGD
jgi:type IV secretory pathway VirB3-like protein